MLKSLFLMIVLLCSFSAEALVCINGKCDNDPLDKDPLDKNSNVISTRPLQDAALKDTLKKRAYKDMYHEQNNANTPSNVEVHIDGSKY